MDQNRTEMIKDRLIYDRCRPGALPGIY